MSKKFAEYSKFDLSNVNKEVLKKWQDGDIFHKSLEIREGYPSFVFYEGPPSANGMPGIHHVIARSIKDIFCRYKTMKGFLVNRKAGWDTHGLPVELGVEKSMGITKEDIGKKISVADYNAACRRDVEGNGRNFRDRKALRQGTHFLRNKSSGSIKPIGSRPGPCHSRHSARDSVYPPCGRRLRVLFSFEPVGRYRFRYFRIRCRRPPTRIVGCRDGRNPRPAAVRAARRTDLCAIGVRPCGFPVHRVPEKSRRDRGRIRDEFPGFSEFTGTERQLGGDLPAGLRCCPGNDIRRIGRLDHERRSLYSVFQRYGNLQDEFRISGGHRKKCLA